MNMFAPPGIIGLAFVGAKSLEDRRRRRRWNSSPGGDRPPRLAFHVGDARLMPVAVMVWPSSKAEAPSPSSCTTRHDGFRTAPITRVDEGSEIPTVGL